MCSTLSFWIRSPDKSCRRKGGKKLLFYCIWRFCMSPPTPVRVSYCVQKHGHTGLWLVRCRVWGRGVRGCRQLPLGQSGEIQSSKLTARSNRAALVGFKRFPRTWGKIVFVQLQRCFLNRNGIIPLELYKWNRPALCKLLVDFCISAKLSLHFRLGVAAEFIRAVRQTGCLRL